MRPTPSLSSLFRWLARKRYQYEVTFSLYMLTPTEKFIFSLSSPFPLSPHILTSLLAPPVPALYSHRLNRRATPCSHLLISPARFVIATDSFLFLFLSMIIIAASLYLPEHISFIVRRAWFYWGGDEVGIGKRGEGGGSEGGGFVM